MIASYQKYKKKKSTSPYIIAFLIVLSLGILVILLNLNLKMVKKRAEVEKELSFLQKKLQKEKLKREKLLTEISKTKNPYFLERIARESLDLKKEGEKVVAFPVIKNGKNQTSTTETVPESKSFWEKVLEKLRLKKD